MTYAQTVAVSFGVAHFAVLGLSLFNWKNINAWGCAFMLVMIWVASMVLAWLYEPPVSMVLNPILDMIGVVVSALVFFGHWKSPRWWSFGLMLAFIGQGWCDVLFWGAHDGSHAAIRNYSRVVDYLLAAELFCVALPGVGYVGHLVSDVLRRVGGASGRPSVRRSSKLAS